MKKIVYAILICIIIAGGVMFGINKLEVGLPYSKSTRIDIYIGKDFENKEIEKIAKEVLGTNQVWIQKVELFEDMVAITIKDEEIENFDEKLENLNTKLNEKYEIENKTEDITVTNKPNVRLSSLIQPYIFPCVLTGAIILVYVAIRFRKVGAIKTIGKYAITILMAEAVYFSIFAIARIPINPLTIPIGLVIYILAIGIITIMQEGKLQKWKLEENNKKQ